MCKFLVAVVLMGIPLFATGDSSITGEWEGQLLSARRPVVVYVNFDKKIAKLDVSGSEELGLENVSTSGTEVKFAIPIRGQKIEFQGTRIGGQIAGTAALDTKVGFALDRLPELPAPTNRIQAWSQDIEALIHRFFRYDRSYSDEQRREAIKILSDLKSTLPQKSDEKIIVELSRAVARTENAHTRLYLLRNRTILRRLPIRVWWFQDGLYVVKATREYQDLPGCRVVAIGRHEPSAVRSQVSQLFAGNDSWKDYKSVYYITSPEILRGLGLIDDIERPEFTFQCSGEQQKRIISPLPLEQKSTATEAWWDLTPAWKDEPPNWVQGLVKKMDLPLYLQHPEKHYWFESIPSRKALYFQYNRSQNQKAGENLQQFGERLIAAVDGKGVQKLIVDLRFNTGGDLGIARDLMEKLKTLSNEKKIDAYVLLSRATFSAGISHAAQWRGQATFVGEPAGDVLDFFSEGGNVVLPNSKLFAHYANGFHSYSKREYPQYQPHFLDMDVEDLKPDVLVQVSSDEYFAGRDPFLEAIFRPGR